MKKIQRPAQGWFLGLLFTAAAGMVGAQELPLFVIPHLARPPVIDGRINSAGWPQSEWDMAVPLAGFTLTRPLAAPPVLVIANVGYDEKALYIRVSGYQMDGTAITCMAHERDTEEWKDDSVEVHLGAGENPQKTCQFVVNADNAVYDATNEGATHDPKWNPEWKHGTARRGDGWDAEMAIPWQTLGLETPAIGQVLRINIAFNFHVQGQKNIESACWGPILDEKDKTWTFHSLKFMPVARFGGMSAAAGSSLMVSKSGGPELRLKVVNPAAAPVTVKYCLQAPAWNDLNVAGEKWTSALLPVKTGADGLGAQPIQVKGPGGEVIFRQVAWFRSRFASNVGVRKYFPDNYLEIVTEGLPEGSKALVEVKDPTGGIVPQNISEVGGEKSPRLRLDIGAWRENSPYTLTVKLVDPAGGELGTREFSVTRPSVPAWLGTKAGLTDKPLPPFTAIEIQSVAVPWWAFWRDSAPGVNLKCLQTGYEFARRALPVGITARGAEILAAPVSLTCVLEDGERLDLAAAPVRVRAQKANRVEWTASCGAGDLAATLDGWMEEDGFVWYTLAITPCRPLSLRSLELTVPLRRDCVKWVNATMPLEGGAGTGDKAFKFEKEWRADDFYPMINLLNEDRGLTVMASDPRNWSNKDENRRQIIQTTPTATIIKFAFVDQPTLLEKPRIFEFGFQAMPAKPIAKTARRQRRIHDVHYGEEILRPGAKMSRVEYAASLGAKTLINHNWTEDYGSPRPAGKAGELKALVTACHRYDLRLLLYLGYGLGAFMPESQVYEDYWKREPVTVYAGRGRNFFRTWCNKTHYTTDFILDGISKTLQEFDFDGFYYDGAACTYPCANQRHDCGWVDSKGKVHPAFPLLENRRFAKRLYAIAKQHNPRTWIDWHGSGGMSAWAAAWADNIWSGEQFIDKWRQGRGMTIDEFCAQYMAAAYGSVINYIWLYPSSGVPLSLEQQMAFALLVNAEPEAMLWKENNIALISELWRIKDGFGVDDAEWIPFTKSADFLSVSGEKSYASLYLVKGKHALLVVANLRDEPAEVTLNLHLSKLGLAGKVKDARTNQTISAVNGTVTLSLDKYDWKLLEVEKEEAQ